MSLRHAILTALSERPSSGLDLARRFDRSIGYFWSATHQQIYRELGNLVAGGFIEERPEPTAQGKRKTFDVLPAGRAELESWVIATSEPRPLRDELLLRLRARAVVGGPGPVDELRRHLELHHARLAQYREIEERDFRAPPDEAATVQYLVLRAGIGLEEFWIAWLADAISTLRTLEPLPTERPV